MIGSCWTECNIDLLDEAIKYIVIDAAPALANAIKSSFPRADYEEVNREISALHRSLSKHEYDDLLKTTLNRWKTKSELQGFHEYLVKQWINSDFSNWQLFHAPPGYASTNNPLEQYNARIKQDFTKRFKHHLLSSHHYLTLYFFTFIYLKYSYLLTLYFFILKTLCICYKN